MSGVGDKDTKKKSVEGAVEAPEDPGAPAPETTAPPETPPAPEAAVDPGTPVPPETSPASPAVPGAPAPSAPSGGGGMNSAEVMAYFDSDLLSRYDDDPFRSSPGGNAGAAPASSGGGTVPGSVPAGTPVIAGPAALLLHDFAREVPLKLQGIYHGSQGWVAVVNGKKVQAGTTLDSWLVLQVTDGEVIMKNAKGKEYVLRLEE